MSKKTVFFAFQGEKMCFVHLLLNALDLHKKGLETKIVIEGKATKLLKTLVEEENPLLSKVMELGLIDSICRACSHQMGVLEFNEGLDIPLNGDLEGHPPMEPYINQGFEVIIL